MGLTVTGERRLTSREFGRAALLSTIGLWALAGAASAFAQDTRPTGNNDKPGSTSTANALEEVVVTATRQVDTVNRVPLSVTAQTQKALDQQGVRALSDLTGAVPALTPTAQQNPSVANVAIRGISDLNLGAPTTGFYLDDTPLQKRNVGGAFSGNGTPLPPLFDLDRVEVLRGPQGTLFGGSSEGGTIRYITPAPSLTKYTGYAKTEVSATDYGGPSYEAGVAVGGPIVQDKLGFRVSVYGKHTGGWLDYVDRIDKQVRYEDANDGDTRLFRGTLLWAPSERSRVTFSYFESHEHYDTTFGSTSPSITNPLVANPVCFNTTGVTPTKPKANPAVVPCGSAGVTYRRPGFTYGPYNLDDDQTLAQQALTPSTVNLRIPTLTLEYLWPFMTVKSITSLVYDENKQVSTDGPSSGIRDANDNITYGPYTITRQFTSLGQIPNANYQDGLAYTQNKRNGVSQELRFSSAGAPKPFTWVAGVFYSNFNGKQQFDNTYVDTDLLAQTLYGISFAQRYGATPYLVNGLPVGVDAKRQRLHDNEVAAFGEINYWLLENLKLTAGVRIARVAFDYTELHFGAYSGFNVPTAANGGGPNSGSVSETPVSPKFGVEYEFTPNDFVYFTASKGYRPGGVNGNLPAAICDPGFGQYGLTSAALPVTYNSDTVWSYELGGKVRTLNNRVQINADVYRIDWTNPQLAVNVGLACPAFTGNAGSAQSQGIELEAQARIINGLTANLSFGYDDAKYTENALALSGANPPLYAAFEGQKIAVPPVTLSVGARYDTVIGRHNAYIRGDFRYIQHYTDTIAQVYSFGGFTNANFAPDALYPDTYRLNIRAGVEFERFDVNVFVNNLLGSLDGVTTGGRASCLSPAAGGTAACTTFATYNPFLATAPANFPRQIGLQVSYRF